MKSNVSPVPPVTLTGIILAGGHSRRMGQDKALLPVGGVPLVRRTVDLALGCCDRVAVLTAWGDRYRAHLPPACELWPDGTPGAGPVGALVQGWPQVQTPWVLVLACDLPRLTGDLLGEGVGRLAGLPEGCLALLPPQAKGWDALCGFYRREVGTRLAAYGERGGRSLQGWLAGESMAGSIVPWPVDPALLWNCNTPQDYDTLIDSGT